ncbi:hypothetical protein HNQ91_002976 [Filimonas zeae]|uniref:DUF4142 domain-containing protein n=1 Tax=Filimonas zeae TaxID=1737353 RepID=A0A917J0R4_9BACT|nr:hypothetical protein [Filimonas zeae]MDR6339911.1 hypothetical protein [Filimonas zeae]GGH70268.1 hypothetical protein GCM10011379_28360 [Filimonas zeae]
MKRSFLVAALLLCAAALQAQTFAEWFKQKKTQTKYSLAQIAAYQAYMKVLEKGYDIAKNGLGAIGSIKSGDYNQHNGYFSSLKTVSPAVQQYAAASNAVALQTNIMRIYSSIKNEVLPNEWLSAADKQYMQKVLAVVLDRCSDNMDELTNLSTNGQLELKDDERMQRMSAVCRDMQDIYVFMQHFGGGARILIAQRQKEYMDSKKLQSLLGTGL